MRIRAAVPADLPAILDIYNHAVATTTAVWNEHPVDLQNRLDWFNARHVAGLPVLVAVATAGNVCGYASYGEWRAWSGYRHTVEHSIHVAERARGQGYGRALLEALIREARCAHKHVMVAGIEASNAASIALHASCGFRLAGRLEQVGCKFGRWLDLLFLQLILDVDSTPEN